MLNFAEMEVSRLVSDLDIKNMLCKDGTQPPVNLCNIIAVHRGWRPLMIGETMTVGFGDGTEYRITRNENRQ